MTAPVTANQPAAYPPFPPHYPRQGSALSGIAITLSILGLTASGIALTASYFSNERVARLERQIDAQAGQSAS